MVQSSWFRVKGFACKLLIFSQKRIVDGLKMNCIIIGS